MYTIRCLLKVYAGAAKTDGIQSGAGAMLEKGRMAAHLYRQYDVAEKRKGGPA